MRWLVACLICSFLVTVITTQDCSPCECSWDWQQRQLTARCSYWLTGWSNLTEIPDTINRNASELFFNGQAFTILKNNTFATFHNLTMISFGLNKIQIIERQTFKNLTKLTNLWLSFNNIQSLPNGIFHDLRQIQRIDLAGNSIAVLPNNIFSNLSTLKELWLSGNKLEALPAGLFDDLRQIEQISLSNNRITELHKQMFSNLATLEHLLLHTNKIKALPDGIFQGLRKIEKVYLSGNGITKLQKYLFSNLPHLIEVDISFNKINTIEDESFSKLPNLKRVDLRKNKLKKIGINIIDDVQQLKHFDLIANPWHCDEDLCAVIDSVSSSVFHETKCQTPAETENKTWAQLLFNLNNLNFTRNVEDGDTAYLECKYCLASKILWKFNNKRISRDHSVDISKLSLTSTLILRNVTQDDSGHYSCHVQDCATCKIAGAYLNVNYRKHDDKKYTVKYLVPTTSLVTQSTTTEDPADTSTHSSTSLYLIVAVAVSIILVAIGISIFYLKKCRKHKIQQKAGTEFKYSCRRGSDPVPSPPLEPGWGSTPRTLHTPDNTNQSPSNHTTNKHTSSNNTANRQTTSNNRRNEQTLSNDINDETTSISSRNEQPTSNDRRSDETSNLLPLESVE